jgi:hypothetical protein
MAEARQVQGRRRPARRRLVLQALGVVVAVVLLLWGADTLARISAQTLLEQNIQEATGVEVRPEVEVQGLFFLPQVIRGVYSEVHVTTRGITSGPLRIDRVDSQLFDVQVPFHDVLVRNIRQVGIGRSVENLDLTYDDLNAYLEATGRKLKLSPGSDGTVTLSGNVNILGQSLRVSADVTLSVQDDLLRISPQNFGVGAVSLDAASRLLLHQRQTLTVPLGTLPFGHHLTGVQADHEGVHLTAEGADLLISP